MIPQADYILVRGPRTGNTRTNIWVSIQRNNGWFDFSDYSFLRMMPHTTIPIEEWVPTKELDVYKKIFDIKE